MKTCPNTNTFCVLRPHGGVVLLLCLLFLLALSLLGLSASSDTILQNRLSANLQDSERAKQSARLALSWAERWILSMQGPAPEYCPAPCNGLRLHVGGDLPPRPEFENFDWWLAHGHEAGVDPVTGDRVETITADSIKPPVWLIEVVQTVTPGATGNPDLQVWYRIMARGTGHKETAISVVESIVVRTWPEAQDNEAPDSEVAGVCPGFATPAICGRFSWREVL